MTQRLTPQAHTALSLPLGLYVLRGRPADDETILMALKCLGECIGRKAMGTLGNVVAHTRSRTNTAVTTRATFSKSSTQTMRRWEREVTVSAF